MLSKSDCDQSEKSRCFGSQKRKFKFLRKMTRSASLSPYVRMGDEDGYEEVKKMKKNKMKVKNMEAEEEISKDDKENKDSKDKKSKKKTWKLIRQATLSTCRYIGLGVAHMSPAAVYGAPDYCIDPKHWNKSFNSNSKTKPEPTPQPHWTSSLVFSSW